MAEKKQSKLTKFMKNELKDLKMVSKAMYKTGKKIVNNEINSFKPEKKKNNESFYGKRAEAIKKGWKYFYYNGKKYPVLKK